MNIYIYISQGLRPLPPAPFFEVSVLAAAAATSAAAGATAGAVGAAFALLESISTPSGPKS